MSNLPTLLFIPGSWHKPECYQKVIKIIQEQSELKCISASLPSNSGDPAAGLKDDIDVAREAITSETVRGHNIVVIAHSYGGLVGNSVIKGFTRPKNATVAQSSMNGYVIGLILIASGFSFTGLSFMDPFLGYPPPTWRVNRETGFSELVTPPRELFYHDLPMEEAEFWVSQLTNQSLKALFEGGEHSYSGWRDLPVWYIGTVEDRGLPVLVQRMQIGMAREMGCSVEHRELQTSHSPFLSQPEATVTIIVDAIRAFVGSSEGHKLTHGSDPKIMMPKVALWQPSTWLKFGLPLVFGHVIGRSVLLFLWGRSFWRSSSS